MAKLKKNEVNIDDISFTISENSFNRNSTLNSTDVYKYNSLIMETNKSIEAIDRFDDFQSLKIAPNQYKKDEDSIYGIPYNKKIHIYGNDEVILPHQQKACEKFLRDLRGFGLLADVVGSGKTYEAGVVLSELAIRNKIKSMLFIVPSQVIDVWQSVMELQFGLGEGSLIRIDYNEDKDNSDLSFINVDMENRPTRPILVADKAFACWGYETANLLFDAIVVDEAHNLCASDGEYAKTMELLSLMMETKKKHNKSYCVLLSATPHSGNLANMFRLWYFIRCKGGTPKDFEANSNVTESFKDELDYYTNEVCRGAVTVKEFIDIVRRDTIVERYVDKFMGYVYNENEADGQELSLYMSKFVSNNMKVDIKNNYKLRKYLDEFYISLDEDADRDMKADITKRIASAYHDGVLRTIMIRQPNKHMRKNKRVENYLFYPTYSEFKNSYEFDYYGTKFSLRLDLIDTNKAISFNDNNEIKEMSLLEFGKLIKPNNPQQGVRDILMNNLIPAIDETNNDIFKKKGSITYYGAQILGSDKKMGYYLNPVKYTKEIDNKANMLNAKYNKTLDLLAKHSNERVIIYFDYDLPKIEKTMDEFISRLNNSEFKNRVLVGNHINIEGTIKKFNEIDNAILVVYSPSFTEGANLQKSRVIINFQVTVDPLQMDQRIGRIFRLGQEADEVIIYSLADMSELEGYVLMYFERIGLMGSNNGDVTIIAGANNERMVALRCKKCSNVMLMNASDYELERQKGIFCGSEKCIDKNHPLGLPMKEITVYDFKCDRCNITLSRSVAKDNEGYPCLSNTFGVRGVMANSGVEGDRRLYCRKICSIAHCDKFLNDIKCKALDAFKKNSSIGEPELLNICSECNNPKCPEKCRLTYKYADPTEAIRPCMTCDDALCSPKPHILDFGLGVKDSKDEWISVCPNCKSNNKKGLLRPVVARTFATYIRGAWNFDGAKEKFCHDLSREVLKVSDIKTILDTDEGDE